MAHSCRTCIDTVLHTYENVRERKRRNFSFIFHPCMKDEKIIFHPSCMKDETVFHPWMIHPWMKALKWTRPIRKVEKRLAWLTLFLYKQVRQDSEFSCVWVCPATTGPFQPIYTVLQARVFRLLPVPVGYVQTDSDIRSIDSSESFAIGSKRVQLESWKPSFFHCSRDAMTRRWLLSYRYPTGKD